MRHSRPESHHTCRGCPLSFSIRRILSERIAHRLMSGLDEKGCSSSCDPGSGSGISTTQESSSLETNQHQHDFRKHENLVSRRHIDIAYTIQMQRNNQKMSSLFLDSPNTVQAYRSRVDVGIGRKGLAVPPAIRAADREFLLRKNPLHWRPISTSMTSGSMRIWSPGNTSTSLHNTNVKK